MTKGKCLDCRKAFEWKGKPRLRDAHCPFCGRLLIATTYELGSGKNRENWKWDRKNKPVIYFKRE